MSKKTEKKKWGLTSKEGARYDFFPQFVLTTEDNSASGKPGEVECQFIRIEWKDQKGNDQHATFNYLDLYMFIYYCCNEELRQNLAMRYERQVSFIPYEVSFKLSPEEKSTAIVKRSIQLEVDELIMAIARNEAWKMLLKKGGNPKPGDFIYKKFKK